MRSLTWKSVTRLGAGSLVLLVVALVLASVINVRRGMAADPVDPADPKAADLARALANGGESPDRLIVVYHRNAPPADPLRVQVRHEVGAQLLHADVAVPRDVLRVPTGTAASAASALRAHPGVRDAYPDRVVSMDFTPNDPLFSQEWGLSKINAPAAWDTSQAQGVSVAVLDCGIHGSHPDLQGKVRLERNFTTTVTTDDLCNHGTHVAGTIGALTNNGVGVAAVAPQASLLNGKVLNDTGNGFLSDIDTAMQWAADNGARVINMSLGASGNCPAGTQAAADYAWSRGAVLVAAAGNAGSSGASAPGNCNNVIGVAATDVNDNRASFSNYGTKVEIAAPGVGILSTVNPALNTGNSYASFSGTSMATPHVAGAAALVWATAFGTSPAAVRDRLFTSADRIAGTGSLWTYGRLNAAQAVGGGGTIATSTPTATATLTASPTPTATPSPTAIGGTTTQTFTVAASGDDGDVGVSGPQSAGFPPTGSPAANTSGSVMTAGRRLTAWGQYEVLNALVRFDTSALPANAVITSAALRVYVTTTANGGNRNLVADWYSAWPIDSAAWTATPANTALAGVAVGSLNVDATNDLPLQNLTNVSRTGYTGLRMHIDGGTPTADNLVQMASFDNSSRPKPQLIITYRTGP